MLDFGKGFFRRARFFEEYLKPRSANGLVDFIEMGLIPDVEGIYREDLLEMAGRKAGSPTVDAVLVSHAHADHVDYISFLHHDIPLYMGARATPYSRQYRRGRPATLSAKCLIFCQSRQREGPSQSQER
ncbi:putative hydrolase of the metallo-beta-lactamase superfamily [Candidatus Nitrososphaera gargensis Ga9.2]|uniref:Putative hydrolase of the metallo-beta-lactamase superfamily n=1 Tax=Nitrososphaera gargensis (strain Ga9.2) TaxID=1237085 RepID=K0I743_NITGG|nr:putative hydrolase of the metallo-beta-lactamase superfamily [Candidatus Nitrososphaera gargensis Ga9.2]